MRELEQFIKQELEARKIEPSAQSWDRIRDEMNPNSPKKTFSKWRYIAACLFLVGALGLLFLNNQNTGTTNVHSIVKEEQQASIKEKPTKTVQPKEKWVSQTKEEPVSEPLKKVKNEAEKQAVSQWVAEVKPISSHSEVDTMKSDISDFHSKEKESAPILLVEEDSKTLVTEEATTMENTEESRIKINREKLLFYIENEQHIQKPKRIAFENSTLSYDLNED